jgi:hypothetical protein
MLFDALQNGTHHVINGGALTYRTRDHVPPKRLHYRTNPSSLYPIVWQCFLMFQGTGGISGAWLAVVHTNCDRDSRGVIYLAPTACASELSTEAVTFSCIRGWCLYIYRVLYISYLRNVRDCNWYPFGHIFRGALAAGALSVFVPMFWSYCVLRNVSCDGAEAGARGALMPDCQPWLFCFVIISRHCFL